MKIKSPYRRPSRRLSRRNQNGLFFQQECAEPSFFQSRSHAAPQAKGEETAAFLPKESEEEAAKAKEEEEASQSKEEEEAAAKEEEESAAKEEEEEAAQTKEEEEPAAKEEEETAAKKMDDSPGSSYQNKLTPHEHSAVDSAVSHAKQLTGRAIDLISQARGTGEDGSDALDKYEQWFGPMDEEQSRFVLEVFRKIRQNLSSSSLIFTTHDRADLFAFVKPSDNALKVWLCGLFWNKAASSGFNSRGGVILHELAHEAQMNIGDFGYGKSKAQKLAFQPSLAIRNADNYQFFAESL